MLRARLPTPADPGTQNRFSSMRILRGAGLQRHCADPASFKKIYTSKANAFHTHAAPGRVVRTWSSSRSTCAARAPRHLMCGCSHAVHRQPAVRGEQDNDPNSATDCATGQPGQGTRQAAEFTGVLRWTR
ncbi:hypothetical protein GCM10020220_075110 [Nonomuraea rubra]|uniref:hypothetical protein n=1 Tax=Nonomuraea rubra TaxID=46180 RepID=UPI0031E6D3E6